MSGKFSHFLKGDNLFTMNQRVEKATQQFPLQRFYFHRTAFEHAKKAHLPLGKNLQKEKQLVEIVKHCSSR